METTEIGSSYSHSQLQGYQNPTLDDYHLCKKNRENCIKNCPSNENSSKCLEVCPKCPILFEQDVVVQGINDTGYRMNTTNIIRLTNEIRNIIDYRIEDVKTLSQNNINGNMDLSSKVGGKFGLGFNQNGSCCIVVQSSAACSEHSFSASTTCHHKRHKVCGQGCTARVMYAKRVTHCPDFDQENCYETIEYLPSLEKQQIKCSYSTLWPFVSCPSSRNLMQKCQSCFQIPYIYVMQRNIPHYCIPCFSGGGYGITQPVLTPLLPPLMSFYNPFWPYMQSIVPNYSENLFIPQYPSPIFNSEENWTVDTKKCRDVDALIAPNIATNVKHCDSFDSDPKTELPIQSTTKGFLDNQPELQDAPYENLIRHKDIYWTERHRRQSKHQGIRRSKYSRRRRQ